MTAVVTPIRGAAFAALVQRPGRKAHLAAVASGSVSTFCNRELEVDGTEVTSIDSPSDALKLDDEVLCAWCCRMAGVALLVERMRPVVVAPVAGNAFGSLSEWQQWYGSRDGAEYHAAATGGVPRYSE